MSNYNSKPITQFTPGAAVLPTDVYLATDITDSAPTHPSGFTKKYTIAQLQTYLVNSLSGSNIQSARVATTTALTAVYNNGTAGVGATLTNAALNAPIAIDGITLALGDRVLVKDQGAQLTNGVYTVTNVGSISTSWVLTRAADYDGGIQIIERGDFIGVVQGTVNELTFWFQTAPDPIVVGIDPIIFQEDLGQVTSASNIGTGAGVFSALVGTDLQFKSLTAGTNITLTPSPTDITITANGLQWSEIIGTTQLAAVDSGYIPTDVALTSITLPLIAPIGSIINVQGKGAGGWELVANVGQTINLGAAVTSVGGSLASANQFDNISVVCITANSEWATNYVYSSGLVIT
jgi:hypothetical protein